MCARFDTLDKMCLSSQSFCRGVGYLVVLHWLGGGLVWGGREGGLCVCSVTGGVTEEV